MKLCLYQDIDDDCELFYDLDEDERSMLYCTGEGECLVEDEFDECPLYLGVWED